ncbi:hypothetical protein DB30_02026 [Enhygromyxa salina]|uniref:Uncharacterized protein n=1 Tax=Enhygromyxa salina TaxID=215803 RepID=A0A0C2CLJ4_9BACT|nr:hypothetical protein DB30_02026 [Enhygromyxa salina]
MAERKLNRILCGPWELGASTLHRKQCGAGSKPRGPSRCSGPETSTPHRGSEARQKNLGSKYLNSLAHWLAGGVARVLGAPGLAQR